MRRPTPPQRSAPAPVAPPRDDGAFALMSVPLLIVMVGLCGLALDLGQLYNRKADLDGMAKAVALAAARELNGTEAGIAGARARARQIAEGFRYRHFGAGAAFAWDDAALTFGATPARSGTWVASGSAGARASTLYFAKVDTAGLGAPAGVIAPFFIQALSNGLGSMLLNDSAVAGRIAVDVTPLAVCAMAPERAAVRTAGGAGGSVLRELVQHGFRRGVSYDLMALNPAGTTPRRYLVNPVSPPGMDGTTFSAGITPAFLCAGTMWMPRLSGGTLQVTQLPAASPLSGLDIAINSRFDVFAGSPCSPWGAPPDYNIRSYAYDEAGGVTWMRSPATGSRAAARVATGGRLQTAADVATPPAAPGDYGPLWSYARAVRAPEPADAPEPEGGYATFAPADWAALYPNGPGAAANYPARPPAPYLTTDSASGFYTAPRAGNLEISTWHRRVLNLPLLACTASAPAGANAPATALAIGRFFMTVPATPDRLVAEFAGLLPESALAGQVALFP